MNWFVKHIPYPLPKELTHGFHGSLYHFGMGTASTRLDQKKTNKRTVGEGIVSGDD